MGNRREMSESVGVTLPAEESRSRPPSYLLNSPTLAQLSEHFRQGIVTIYEDGDLSDHQRAFKADPTAGTTLEAVQERLLDGNGTLLERAARLQRGGELIGAFPDGRICIIDGSYNMVSRDRQLVVIAFDDDGRRIVETADTQNELRLRHIEQIAHRVGHSAHFANYHEIRQFVHEGGFVLPPKPKTNRKEGIIAAAEAVTGKPFILGMHRGMYCAYAVLESGDDPGDYITSVAFEPRDCEGYESGGFFYPSRSEPDRSSLKTTSLASLRANESGINVGAIRVLIG